jgi:hypothetical protein
MNRLAAYTARAFDAEEPSDDAPTPSEAPADAESEDQHDYSFEGYSVEFLDKVALLPISPKAQAAGVTG